MNHHQEPRLEGPAQYGKSNTHVIHHIPIIQTKQLVSGSSLSNIGLTRRLRPQMIESVPLPHSSINPQAWPISNPTAFTNLGSPFYADKNEQTAIITESPLGIYNYDSRGFLIPFPTSYQQHYLNYLDNSRNLQNVGLFTRPSSLDTEYALMHPSRDMMEKHALWDRSRLIDFDDSRRETTTISSDASTTSSDTTQYRCRRSQEHLCDTLVDSDDTAHKPDEKVQNVQGFRCIFPNLPLNTRSRRSLQMKKFSTPDDLQHFLQIFIVRVNNTLNSMKKSGTIPDYLNWSCVTSQRGGGIKKIFGTIGSKLASGVQGAGTRIFSGIKTIAQSDVTKKIAKKILATGKVAIHNVIDSPKVQEIGKQVLDKAIDVALPALGAAVITG